MNGDKVVRKLTTILAADVVGYSRLMTQDEEGTLRAFRAYSDVINRLVEKHGGGIFNTAGDAVLAEFGSAVEGVRCAISIQEDLGTRNAELPEDRRLMLRIGINVGDVMINGDDLMGDGVNVAARLEGLAEPGGVCISSSTFEQVKNKLSIGFQDLGPQEVKNIPYPVGAFQVTTAPVSVVSDPSPLSGASYRPRPGGLMLLSGLLLAGLLGAGIWYVVDGGATHPAVADLPETIGSPSLDAAGIRQLVTGLKFEGRSERSGGNFTIHLQSDGTAALSMAGGNAEFSETGKWWANDRQFCMQFKRFARGEARCPNIMRDAGEYAAIRLNGDRLPWRISRPGGE